MPILGMGTDIVEIERIAAQLQRHPSRLAEKILAESELTQFLASKRPAQLLAKRFAVKEAAAKALGTGIGEHAAFQDIQVEHDAFGKPLLKLSGAAGRRAESLGVTTHHLSIADERRYAVATVILEG